MENGNFSEAYYERLDRYLDQAMTADERERFELELSVDSGLRQQLDQHRLIRIAIMEKSLESAMAGFHVQPKIHRIKAWKGWAAAAVILIASTVYLVFSLHRHDPATLYARFYQPDPGLMTTMGTTEDYAFQVAMIQYKRGDFAGAAAAWEKLRQQRPSSDTLQYFLGCAYQAMNNTAPALQFLQPVCRQPNSAFRRDACWYTGLLLLRQHRIQEAQTFIRQSDRPERSGLLQELSSNGGQ